MFWRSVVLPGIVLQALLQEPVLLILVELAVPLARVVTRLVCEQLTFWRRFLPCDQAPQISHLSAGVCLSSLTESLLALVTMSTGWLEDKALFLYGPGT